MEVTTATQDALNARVKIAEMLNDNPMSAADLMFNLGLYVRSSLLVKFLVMDDLYKRIVNLPGALVEFGCWYGQNLVLLENLRAIHEPFNKSRKIIGFDSFNGYEDGTYAAGAEYIHDLITLLRAHEGANAFGHVRADHEIVPGDVTKTAPNYFAKHESPVALALFDMGPYEPTLAALRAIQPHLRSGSVLMFDEFTTSGEYRALDDVLVSGEYTLEVCKLYPSKTIVTIR